MTSSLSSSSTVQTNKHPSSWNLRKGKVTPIDVRAMAIRVRVTNMQALARNQVRRYSEGHGFGKASGPHTIYLTLTLIALIALTWSEQLRE